MKLSMLKPEFEERRFGSSFDPLLDGVAQGLARLFPPIENVREPDDEGGRSRGGGLSATAEDDGADE